MLQNLPARLTLRFTASLTLAALLVLASPSQAGELDKQVTNLISTSNLRPEQVGVSILDLSTGRPLAEVRSDDLFIPASNMKLLSSGAALVVLGCDFTFKTQLILDGQTLTLLGSGDPALADSGVLELLDPPVTVEGLLDNLASAVHNAGANHIEQIILDDRVFDRVRVHESWPADQLNRWYCAEVDGLSFHANVLRFYPAPAPEGAGNAPIVRIQPSAPWLEMNMRARTVVSGRTTAWVARALKSNRFTIMGDIRRPTEIDVAIHEPSIVFGQLLVDRLGKAGVRVGDGQRDFRVLRLADENEPTPTGRTVAQIVTPIVDIARRCNTDSYNLYAEALLKRMGHEITGDPGSWSNGAAVLRMTMSDLVGANYASATHIADGSGMSRLNKVSPEAMTAWLGAMAKHPTASACFLDSLPTLGQGTLRNRFKMNAPNAEIRAKSGTLNGVRCLSGYLTHQRTGRRLAFSVLVNDLGPGTESRDAKRFHELVVLAADQWLTENSGLPSAKVELGG